MKYLLILFYFFGFNSAPEEYTLNLSIENIQEVKGNIEIGVYNTSDNFLKEGKAIKTYSIAVTGNSVIQEIKDLPKGDYAISLYHDQNSDGKINRNFIGIPKEPYGFSNNFKPKFSKPSFKDCKFSISANKNLKINLID